MVTDVALTVQHEGRFSLNNILLTDLERQVSEESLSWAGKGTTEVNLESLDMFTEIEGELFSNNFHVLNEHSLMEFFYRELNWNGNLSLAIVEDEFSINSHSDAYIDGLNFLAESEKMKLGGIGRIALSNIVLEALDKIDIDEVNIDDLIVGHIVQEDTFGVEPAVFTTQQLQIKQIKYGDNALHIDSIVQSDIVSNVVRGKDGKFNAIHLLDAILRLADTSDEQVPQEDSKTESATTEALAVVIGEFIITGDSEFHFVDQFVNPEFSVMFNIEKAEVFDVDSTVPDQASNISIKAKSGKYSTFTLDGFVKPFLATPEADIKIKLTAMDLPPLTPYTSSDLGLDLKSGIVDSEVDVKLADGKVDGKIIFGLHQFEVESIDIENNLQSRIPLPLNIALDAIRDRINMIELVIPIEGDAENPDFNFNDAIGKALAKGVSKGAMADLTFAL